MNRLAETRSPYLLQHAGNPVDWYPWGAEAFAKARHEGRPIFLSIGYSTCHWCHVMEHESFENAAVAAVLNEHFVSIKVDREERPDVDRVYMTFVQATTGSGGWPMSVWLTPDLKPFYGGTYFPPTQRWGRPGFIEILQEIARVWRENREKVETSAEGLTGELRSGLAAAPGGEVPTAAALARTIRQFAEQFDARHGGFGGAPKFPRPSELLFLLREYARTGDVHAREMVLTTLRAMALGGMRDLIGGGFHRYSVDAGWRVPHFEKMLYDQAQLVLAYLDGAQASGEAFFMDVADDTLRYVMRDMTDGAGGFYSAEDADSVPPEHGSDPKARKMEGAFYLWTDAELDGLLGGDASLVKAHFGVRKDGNAPADPQNEFVGKNLLYVAQTVEELARASNASEADVRRVIDHARVAMFKARLGRPRPHLDDKVLTAWNGLMIGAFARAARLMRTAGGTRAEDAESLLNAARRAADFIETRMWDASSGRLLRRYRQGVAEIDAYAEDYAFLISGALELFQAEPDIRWIRWALALQRRQDELFWDEADGGWFSTTGQDPTVLFRMKEDYDGAEPTATSVSVGNLLVLSHLIEDATWTDRVEKSLRLFAPRLEQMGRAVPMMAAALSNRLAGIRQVVIVGDAGAEELERTVSRLYLPSTIVLRLSAAQQAALAGLLPIVAAMKPVDGRAAAYVCRDFACGAPTPDERALAAALAA